MNKVFTAVLICACVFLSAARVSAGQDNYLTGDIFNQNGAFAAAYESAREDNAFIKQFKNTIAAKKRKKTQKAAQLREQETFDIFVSRDAMTFPERHDFKDVTNLEITQKEYILVYNGEKYLTLSFSAENKYSSSRIYTIISVSYKVKGKKTDMSVRFSINKNNELLINFYEVSPSADGDGYSAFGNTAVIGKVEF